MKKLSTLIMGCLLLVAISILIYSCVKKQDVVINSSGTALSAVPDNLLQAAKEWQATQLKAPGTLNINTVTSHGKLGANWKETELQTMPDGQQLVVVQSPLIKLGPKSKAGVVRKFVFGTNGNTITNGRIIEIFGSAEYIAAHKDNVLENYNVNKLNDFSGSIIEYDINYNYIKSVIYKDGKIIAGDAYIKKDRPKKSKNATNSLTVLDDQECFEVYLVTYYVDGWGNRYFVGEEYLYSFCTGDNNETGGDPPPPSGGCGTHAVGGKIILNCPPEMDPLPPIHTPCNTFTNRIVSLLSTEGGFVNDPNDPGGPTNKGIAWDTWQNTAMSMLGVQPTLTNLQNLTTAQATTIYKALYWDPVHADNINDGDLRYALFDFYVNAGGNAVKTLQKTLNQLGANVSVDGSIGTQTLNAINSADPVALYNTFNSNRQGYYDHLVDVNPSLSKFYNGWTNRVNTFKPKTSTDNVDVNCPS